MGTGPPKMYLGVFRVTGTVCGKSLHVSGGNAAAAPKYGHGCGKGSTVAGLCVKEKDICKIPALLRRVHSGGILIAAQVCADGFQLYVGSPAAAGDLFGQIVNP